MTSYYDYTKMKRRLFIAINLPTEIKRGIEKEAERLKPILDPSVRFSHPENWHLTLSFLGYQDDQDINLIVNSMQTATPKFSPPTIKFKKILYGPPDKSPRMVWILGAPETSTILGKIKNELEDTLLQNGIGLKIEKRSFSAHLTLARFQGIPSKSLLKIEKDLSLEFEAESLDLMESTLKRSGAEYAVLLKVAFKSDL